MTFTSWLSIALICTLGAITPGPSLVVVLRNTMTGSRLHGIATGLAHSAGIGVYAVLCTTGIVLLITNSPNLFKFLTWAGAGYLAWLGWKAWSAAGSALTEQPSGQAAKSRLTAAREGFLVSFLNPKIAVFFLALFSQFVTPEQGWKEQGVLALTAIIIDGGWYTIVALIAGHSVILSALQQRAGLINRLTGISLIAIALKIILM